LPDGDPHPFVQAQLSAPSAAVQADLEGEPISVRPLVHRDGPSGVRESARSARDRLVVGSRGSGLYRYHDGDIYVDGFVRFAVPSATGVIVGGTGAYQGARGTFTSTEAQDVLHLVP